MPDYPGYQLKKTMPRGEGKQVEILCRALSGGLPAGGSAVLYPGGRELRIRSVDSKGGGDFLLGVKGIPRQALIPGSVIVSVSLPVEESREGLFLHDGETVPAESESVRGGLCREFNRERLVGRGSFVRQGSFLAVRFPSPYPMVPGMQCSILDAGGKPRKLTLLWPGRPSRDEMRKLETDAPRRPNPHPDAREVFGRILHTRGYVRIPPELLDGGWDGTMAAGGWLIRNTIAEGMRKKILKLVSRPGGADGNVLRIPDRPDAMVPVLADDMAAAGELVVRNGWFFPPGDPPLSPFHRGWLARVADCGEDGLRASSVRSGADSEALEVLGRSGLLMGGTDLWFHPASFAGLADRLLSGLQEGDSITMADARRRLGGNRLRSIEVLAILEETGQLHRSPHGQERIVV